MCVCVESTNTTSEQIEEKVKIITIPCSIILALSVALAMAIGIYLYKFKCKKFRDKLNDGRQDGVSLEPKVEEAMTEDVIDRDSIKNENKGSISVSQTDSSEKSMLQVMQCTCI